MQKLLLVLFLIYCYNMFSFFIMRIILFFMLEVEMIPCSQFSRFLLLGELLFFSKMYFVQEAVARSEEFKKSVEAKMALRQSNLNPERPGE